MGGWKQRRRVLQPLVGVRYPRPLGRGGPDDAAVSMGPMIAAHYDLLTRLSRLFLRRIEA